MRDTINRLAAAFLLLLGLSVAGYAQSNPGQAPVGTVYAGQGAAPPAFILQGASLDTLCSTNNTTLYRVAGTWVCLTGTSGGVPYFNSSTTIASSALLGANQLVLGGGAGVAPSSLGSLGTSTTVLHGNAGGPPSFGSVANADMATMAANTVKCNPTTSTATPTDCQFPLLNVKDYGAVCNGTGNDATAINNAIAALPASGGVIEFPPSNCRITSAIVIGNGTSSTASTRYGVILRGVGVSGNPIFPGYTASAGPKLTWAGSTGVQGIIQVAGPLQGYGIQNLTLDCASTSGVFGMVVTSASFGDNRNIVTTNCERGIVSTTYALFGSFTNLDNIHSSWINTTVNIPATAGAMGILLTGTASGNSNTDYNNFYNTHISGPTSAVAVTGINLQSTDTVHFYQTHLSGFNASATCIQFDYSVANSFPSSTRFMGLDVGNNCNGGAAYAVNGTPGAAAKANQFMIDGANNTVCPAATLANVSCISPNQFITNPNGNNTGTDILGAWTTFTPSATCGTATFTTNAGRRMTMGKTTHISINFVINALGTCGGANPFTFTLPVANQTVGSITGRNANTGRVFACQLVGTATATCGQDAAAAFAAADNLIASGVYENQ